MLAHSLMLQGISIDTLFSVFHEKSGHNVKLCAQTNINTLHTIFILSKSCIHKRLVVSSVSSGPGVAALLHKLCVTLLLECLPGHLLLHVRALLPCGGGALPGRHGGALLVILVPGHGDGHRVAHLLGDLIADLAGRTHVIADLECKEQSNKTKNLN